MTSEDAVKREAVLNTLDTMDKALDEDRTVEAYKELLAECFKVLPAVTPKPIECEDCVSRDAVLDIINNTEEETEYAYEDTCTGTIEIATHWVNKDTIKQELRCLPTVTPKPKTGKWIKLQHNSDGTSRYMCSECGDTMQLSRHTFATFRSCPKCYAKMEGVQDANID